jgi:hypothetical protein
MLASFFWNIGTDPYHVVLWFSARGAFPRFAGPGEDSNLADKRDLFMEIYNILDSRIPDRPKDSVDDVAEWTVRDLQFQCYVPHATPKSYGVGLYHDHCHESQTSTDSDVIQSGNGVECPFAMRGPSVCIHNMNDYIFPDRADPDSWQFMNDDDE